MNGIDNSAHSMGLQVVIWSGSSIAPGHRGARLTRASPEIVTKPAGTVFGPTTSIGCIAWWGIVRARVDLTWRNYPHRPTPFARKSRRAKGAREMRYDELAFANLF